MEYLQYLDAMMGWSRLGVLNLVISGIPSILKDSIKEAKELKVLNLVISGIPSIPW